MSYHLDKAVCVCSTRSVFEVVCLSCILTITSIVSCGLSPTSILGQIKENVQRTRLSLNLSNEIGSLEFGGKVCFKTVKRDITLNEHIFLRRLELDVMKYTSL